MILILIIILILIFTFIILRITFASNEIAKGNIDIEDLKTGDILFVEYNNSLGNLMRVWSGSKWTHIAMIYEDRNGDKYVCIHVCACVWIAVVCFQQKYR
jgi:hypothetical protein